ncbi:MAG TPA: FGGY family carbohydrate kinase [Pseudonocardia sp.]
MTPAPESVVLAVDCSTTASKAIAVDADGRTVAAARRDLTVESPRGGWHEQDPERWWTATRDALAEAVAALPEGARVRGLCLTHQRESFACFDGQDRALRPALLWVDGRAGDQIARLGSERVQELSGKPPDVTPALYKLAWLRENEPNVLREARHVGDVAAYLHRRLTGRWASSTVSADALGLFDLRHRRWAPELLEMAGVREEQLPDLVAPGSEVGTLTDDAARELGLPAGTPVVAGLGDGQAAGLGAGATEPGVAYLNLGTAMVLGVQALTYVWDPGIRTLAGVAAGTFTPETLLSAGTYLTTWFRTQFGDPAKEGKPDPELDAAAERAGPGADGLLTLPYWNAAQAPYWDPQARGATVGWHGGHTRGHAYRSLMEACAYEARLHLDAMERATGDRVTVIRAMGGGVRSPLWRQIVADVTGRPLEVCTDDEISARGAAVLGFAATDDAAVLHDTAQRMTPPTRTVEPDAAAHERYGPLYEVYRTLYPALRDVFPALRKAVGH